MHHGRPERLPAGFREVSLQSSLKIIGGKCRPICVGSTMQRMLAAGAVRQWLPTLLEVNLSERKVVVGVPGGVAQGAMYQNS